MAQRKRKRSEQDPKTAKPPTVSTAHELPVRRDLLEQCYAQVSSLREYLLGKLPSSSRLRRKKISAIGNGCECPDFEVKLANLLDSTLVCSTELPNDEDRSLRWQQWLSFSQQDNNESYVTISGTPGAATHFQGGVGPLPPPSHDSIRSLTLV